MKHRFKKPNRKPTMSFSLDDFMYYVDFDERTINLYRKRKAEQNEEVEE